MLEAKYSRNDKNQLPSEGESVSDENGLWAAPATTAPLTATITLPGSKSLTTRELVLSALAEDPSRLNAPLESRDTTLMIDALRALGARIEKVGPTGEDLLVTPPIELLGSTSIACGLAGTVMRFVPPVASLALGPTAFDGDSYARHRPMRSILNGLRQLGADIVDEGRGALPFTVHGSGALKGGRVEIDASQSSQFVSGLLLSGARFEEGVHVVHTGQQLPSLPHIEMTLVVLRARGVNAYSPQTGEWVVEPGPIAARDVEIEPDLSNAAPFLAAAIVTGGSVTVPHWPDTTTQVGDQLRNILPAYGASISLKNGQLTVSGSGKISGVQLHVPEAGELAPTLVGLAALAEGPSTITGIGHIRHHETDRIAALVAELQKLGCEAEELPDGIRIQPQKELKPTIWRSYADHRMATTGALIGLRVAGLQVDDIECTSKTLPQFTELWEQLVKSNYSGDHVL